MRFGPCSCWTSQVKGGQDADRKKIKDINKKNQHLSTRCKTNLISAPGDCSLHDPVEAEREGMTKSNISAPLSLLPTSVLKIFLLPCDAATAPVSIGELVVLRLKSLSNMTGNADSSPPLMPPYCYFLFFNFPWILHAAREGNAPSLRRGMRGGDGALASQEPGIMGLQGHIFEGVKQQSPAGIWADPLLFHCCQMESEPQGGQGTLLWLDIVGLYIFVVVFFNILS